MDWAKLIEVLWPILAPLVQLGLATLTGYVLALLAKWIKEKTGATISEAQLKAATEAVLMVEEKAVSAVKNGLPKWSSTVKKNEAIKALAADLPKLPPEKVEKLVDTAVSVTPTVGASAAYKISSEIPRIPGQIQP